MLLYFVEDTSKSGEKSMSAANKCKTTAWASGRTWCVAQVVIIDGIAVWEVEMEKSLNNEITALIKRTLWRSELKRGEILEFAQCKRKSCGIHCDVWIN